MPLTEIHKTQRGVIIGVLPGKKSANDFIVKYVEPEQRMRTPKHVHLIVDLYLKKAGNKALTMGLVDELLRVTRLVKIVTRFPPALQQFSPNLLPRFAPLDNFGEYSTEFLLVVSELIMIQEKTNYPNGVMNLNYLTAFKQDSDIFSVISTVTFRGR